MEKTAGDQRPEPCLTPNMSACNSERGDLIFIAWHL